MIRMCATIAVRIHNTNTGEGGTEMGYFDDPIGPPRGIQKRNQFWNDHIERMAELCCCNMVTTDQVDSSDYARAYDCLVDDADFYAGETEYSMPGYGSVIRSARSIYKRLTAVDSDRTIRRD